MRRIRRAYVGILLGATILCACSTLPRQEAAAQFDKAEMNREYDYGRKMALEGIPWIPTPPGYAAPQKDMMTK